MIGVGTDDIATCLCDTIAVQVGIISAYISTENGQTLRLGVGETAIVGRSRYCDWSLKRAPAYLKSKGRTRLRLQKKPIYNTVSRRHLRIAFQAQDRVEIVNMSGNGTYVDGRLIERHILQVGEVIQVGTYRLEFRLGRREDLEGTLSDQLLEEVEDTAPNTREDTAAFRRPTR